MKKAYKIFCISGSWYLRDFETQIPLGYNSRRKARKQIKEFIKLYPKCVEEGFEIMEANVESVIIYSN